MAKIGRNIHSQVGALQNHYQGPVHKETAETLTVYYIERDGLRDILGVTENGQWIGQTQATESNVAFGEAGTLDGDAWAWSNSTYMQDTTYHWAGTFYWGGTYYWAGTYYWGGGGWQVDCSSNLSATHWVP